MKKIVFNYQIEYERSKGIDFKRSKRKSSKLQNDLLFSQHIFEKIINKLETIVKEELFLEFNFRLREYLNNPQNFDCYIMPSIRKIKNNDLIGNIDIINLKNSQNIARNYYSFAGKSNIDEYYEKIIQSFLKVSEFRFSLNCYENLIDKRSAYNVMQKNFFKKILSNEPYIKKFLFNKNEKINFFYENILDFCNYNNLYKCIDFRNVYLNIEIDEKEVKWRFTSNKHCSQLRDIEEYNSEIFFNNLIELGKIPECITYENLTEENASEALQYIKMLNY